jgi:hypothetical protein
MNSALGDGQEADEETKASTRYFYESVNPV